jgi:hypothetical protein
MDPNSTLCSSNELLQKEFAWFVWKTHETSVPSKFPGHHTSQATWTTSEETTQILVTCVCQALS